MKVNIFNIVPIAFGISMCMTLSAAPAPGTVWSNFTISNPDSNGDITIYVDNQPIGLSNKWAEGARVINNNKVVYSGDLSGAVKALKEDNSVASFDKISPFTVSKLIFGGIHGKAGYYYTFYK